MINGEKKYFSLCFISEDLTHDVPFVHAVQKYATNFIKKNYTEVTKVEYFTDGCAGQYKNYKTILIWLKANHHAMGLVVQ
jgi:hypothetical protein